MSPGRTGTQAVPMRDFDSLSENENNRNYQGYSDDSPRTRASLYRDDGHDGRDGDTLHPPGTADQYSDDLPSLSRTSGSVDNHRREMANVETRDQYLKKESSDPTMNGNKYGNKHLSARGSTLGSSLSGSLAPPSLTPTLQREKTDTYLERAENPDDDPLANLTAFQAFNELPVELMNSKYGDLTSKSMSWNWLEGLKNTTILLLKLNSCVILLSGFLALILLYKQFAIFQEGDLQRNHERPGVAVRGFTDAAFLTMALSWAPYIYIVIMFGFRNTLPVLKYWIPTVSISMLCTWALIFILEWQHILDLGLIKTLPAFSLCALSVVVCAEFMHRVHKIEMIRLRFIVATGSVVAVALLYFFILPPLWFSTKQPFAKFLIRIVAHPLVFEIAGFAMRWVTRSMSGNHPASTWIVMVLLFTFSGIYGRFLVAAMDSTTWTLITAIVLSCEEIFLRLSVGARDRWLYSRLKDPEAAVQRFKTIRALRLRSDLLYLDIIIENTSIIIAGLTLYVFRANVSNETAVDISVSRVATDIALQLALEWLTDTIVLSIEIKSFHIPVPEAWATKLNFLSSVSLRWFYFLGSILFLTSTSYSYIVSAYFDPRVGFLRDTSGAVNATLAAGNSTTILSWNSGW